MLYATKTLPNGNTLEIEVRFDDSCNNGYRTFAITGTETDRKGRFEAGGAIFEAGGAMIVEAAPELAPYTKWHLCGEDQPLHYVANTIYWVEQGNLEYARNSAVWHDATDEDLALDGLEDRLMARLPYLMAEFRCAMESLGFEW